MATLVLAAAGGAAGGAFGGTFLGLSGVAIGKAVGATIGASIDQKLMGAGSQAVEVGRLDTVKLMSSTEGRAIPRAFGMVRVPGQMIWTTNFKEQSSTSRAGGKGAPSGPSVTSYSYSVSFAVALCAGPITRLGRIWADGKPMDLEGVDWELYRGTEDQAPDPLIVAVEGSAPGYRGIAYLVFRDLPLDPFGNRIPQITAEVVVPTAAKEDPDPAALIEGVALVPGSGEYALATTPVEMRLGKGVSTLANVNQPMGKSDLEVSLDHLEAELPKARAASLIVTWFGDDLRAGHCTLRPKVEQSATDGSMPWEVSGTARDTADVVSQDAGRPVFGGTPADASVIESIQEMTDRGLAVMFYPFILMDVPAGNGRPDPYGGAEQAVIPWRGRITTERAPGVAGSPDGTAAATDEVAAFMGDAQPEDFASGEGGVAYSGPQEWSYRRFILHYAHLCALAGGVDSFCIGSEMRGLTQIRDAAGYPAVAALRTLAAEVKAILPGAKIGYAADWSEYFGHQPGNGDRLFHLDPLWADPAIDFVGIDNYMPLSDWRESEAHLDAAAGSIYDLDYLRGNVAGGEGYDWFYASDADRAAQLRTPIADDVEPWVWRYKDLVNWWSQPHHERVGGVRAAVPTAWVPGSKPIWFTEFGCSAVDKGTNQPNVFLDPKSSENAKPYFSTGGRDDLIQRQYLKAVASYWADPVNNPAASLYAGRMLDTARCFVWAWDTRPSPYFPAQLDVWADGENHGRGHWISGRIAQAGLAEVVRDLCAGSGVAPDVAGVRGVVPGMLIDRAQSARASVQPLMLVHGLDAVEAEGRLAFRPRSGRVTRVLDEGSLAVEDGPTLVRVREPEAETADRVRVGYLDAERDHRTGAAEAKRPGAAEAGVTQTELPLVLRAAQAQAVAERWLAEAHVARDSLRFALPPSGHAVEPGDVVTLGGPSYRVDRVEEAGLRRVEAVRVEAGLYRGPVDAGSVVPSRGGSAASGLWATVLELPLLRGDEAPHLPTVFASAAPWPGPATVYAGGSDDGLQPVGQIERPATVGALLEPLPAAAPGRWSEASVLVQIDVGSLQSRTDADVLAGANALALGEGDVEVMQFAGAELVSAGIYRLRRLLRGQAGTDGVMPAVWPAGTDLVALDGAGVQPNLGPDVRGTELVFRVVPPGRAPGHASAQRLAAEIRGVGLRPYAPVQLQSWAVCGNLALKWTRRSRAEGDAWAGLDVPMVEAQELYRVRVEIGGATVREAITQVPHWTYLESEMQADGAGAGTVLAVAQLSDRWGAGPETRMTL